MKIWESFMGEGWKEELKYLGMWALTGLVCAGAICFALYLLQKPLPGDKAAGGAVATFVLVCVAFGSGLFLFFPMFSSLLEGRIPSVSFILGPFVYYAILLVLFVNVPKWDKVVVNVRDGYHDFQRIHQGEPRENQYRLAEAFAAMSRPVWERLAKRREK